MKKSHLSFLLCTVLCLFLLAACSGRPKTSGDAAESESHRKSSESVRQDDGYESQVRQLEDESRGLESSLKALQESIATVQSEQSESHTPPPAPPVATTEELPNAQGPLRGVKIVLDPGHGTPTVPKKSEPVSPGSKETKPAFVSGASGVSTGKKEADLNLEVARQLRVALQSYGASVLMVREQDATELSNVDRAKAANAYGADLFVRIHADGSENRSTKGVSMLVPSRSAQSAALYQKSRKAGEALHRALVASTGATDRGIVERSDMTGFNWAEVPVVLVEMGFLSNPEEDKLLSTTDYQQKIVDGLTSGIVDYAK